MATLPHPDKRHKGGEDAYFISHQGCGALGVADGVGGWVEEGVDPGLYSRLLMEEAEKALEEEGTQAMPQELIASAQARANCAGSSTACVAVMHPDGKLRIANVGDSGIRVMRDGKFVFASRVQQHAFNMPFQLAHPDLLPGTDTADDADVYQVELRADDVILMGTDGLFDNLWDRQTLDIINSMLEEQPRTARVAQAIADRLAEQSHDNAVDTSFRSPWAVEACNAGILPVLDRARLRGGKLDDCTVVVAFVEPEADGQERGGNARKGMAAVVGAEPSDKDSDWVDEESESEADARALRDIARKGVTVVVGAEHSEEDSDWVDEESEDEDEVSVNNGGEGSSGMRVNDWEHEDTVVKEWEEMELYEGSAKSSMEE